MGGGGGGGGGGVVWLFREHDFLLYLEHVDCLTSVKDESIYVFLPFVYVLL